MRDVVRPSAARFSDFCLVSAIASLLLAVLALVLWLASRNLELSVTTRESLWAWATATILISILPGGLATTWFYVRGFRLVKREEALGYSTGQYNPRKLRIIDPRTGLILREAADPPFTSRREVAGALARAQMNQKYWSVDKQVHEIESSGDGH